MERAEEATYAEIGRIKREVIEPRLAQYQGRLIKTMGDGMLAEFASPVAAVRCAVEIQDHLSSIPDALELRIGLNLGDVIVQETETSTARASTWLPGSKVLPIRAESWSPARSTAKW
jgi:adenylate cyclase